MVNFNKSYKKCMIRRDLTSRGLIEYFVKNGAREKMLWGADCYFYSQTQQEGKVLGAQRDEENGVLWFELAPDIHILKNTSLIPIEPRSCYSLSCKAKTDEGASNHNFYLGFQMTGEIMPVRYCEIKYPANAKSEKKK